MKNRLMLAAGLAAVLVTAGGFAAHSAKEPAYITAALADAGRTDDDKKLDADRKPADMVMFAGIKPGSRVLDLIAGGGYFTRIFARVVGDKGYVYAYAASETDAIVQKRFPGADPKKQFLAYSNVAVLHAPIMKYAAPELLDVVWTAQNYHDLHTKLFGPADVAVLNKAIYDSLKPGGYFVVLDHSAVAGSGLDAVSTLHRIDEKTLIKEIEAAGFKLVASSNILRNKDDKRDKLVFDPSIRHHTDQFVLKFQKPRH